MKKITTILASCLILISASFALAAPTPQQVLQYVDEVRAPDPNFIFTVQAQLIEKPNASKNVFSVMVRESKKSLVQYREPVKQRGRVLLMDGPDMWIFIPGTSRALRISPQQQLVGGVSHADIARVVFSLDYTAEKLDLVEENGKKLLKLSLTATGNTPYKSIVLYCTYNYEPVKAEFFSLSGKLLRTAHYENYQMVLGRNRPMSVRMISAVTDTENVLLTYTAMEVKETPQAYYQPSYLNQIR